jgi:5-methylcytosine-specific restriction endonuclease McrA
VHMRERARVNEQKRRARERSLPDSFSIADWRALLARSPRCHWCKRPFNAQRRATHDHVIPIIKGGANSVENSVASCTNCNLRKGTRAFNPNDGQGILL